MEIEIPSRLAALGHDQRLAIFRLLMRRFPDQVPAGEIANALTIKPSTLSTYLSTLMQVGLVTQSRRGTSLRYSLDMTTVRQTLDYLRLDCCRGRPELCEPHSNGIPMKTDPYHVLFICTGNSARSIFAETLLRAEGGGRFIAHSAGTQPYSELNPFALQILKSKGHDTTGLRAKTISEFQAPGAIQPDFVFTVCDRAANEDCAAWPGQPVTGHWGVPDPVKVTGTDAEKSLAFQKAYGALLNRIQAFAALPLDSLNRINQQQAVDDIGRMDFDQKDTPT